MSFAESLDRLRQAMQTPPRGHQKGKTVVDQRDLNDLLYHFDRLDREARERAAGDREGG